MNSETTTPKTPVQRLVIVPFCPPEPATAYYCSEDRCSESHTTDAKDLFWVAGWNGWYCIDCISEALESDEELMIGPTVSEWLATRNKKAHSGKRMSW
jgi:hypothetical protein